MENNNQIISVQNNNSNLVLAKQSRPLLATLNEDFKKLKDIINVEETDSLINYLLTILNIKVSNEQDAKDLQIQMLVVSDFLKSKFGNLTIPEIKEAFKMFVAREFSHIKVFRILDCVSIGEVLQAYTEFRNESLRMYSQKKQNLLSATPKLTPEQKKETREKFIIILYEELKTEKFSYDAWVLYSDLESAGKIKPTNDYKKELYNKQLLVYSSEQRNLIIKTRGQFAATSLLSDLTKKIQSGNPIETVKNKCKNIIVCDYLKNHMYDFETFKKAIL